MLGVSVHDAAGFEHIVLDARTLRVLFYIYLIENPVCGLLERRRKNQKVGEVGEPYTKTLIFLFS